MSSDVGIGTLVPLVDSSGLRGDAVALRQRAARDGYLWLRGLHDPGAVSALGSAVLAACEQRGWLAPDRPREAAVPRAGLRGFTFDDPRTIELQVAILPSPELERVRRTPALLAVLRAVLGAEPAPHQGDVCRVVFPDAEEHTTPPHQDGAYVGAGRECWTVWTPLGECPLVLGPLALLPGSHRHGLLPHDSGRGAASGVRSAPEDGWAAADLAAGDALLFHHLTLHRALPNHGATLRLSVDCRYRAEESAFAAGARSDPEDRS